MNENRSDAILLVKAAYRNYLKETFREKPPMECGKWNGMLPLVYMMV